MPGRMTFVFTRLEVVCYSQDCGSKDESCDAVNTQNVCCLGARQSWFCSSRLKAELRAERCQEQ